jgi:filamentous hemagglutinin
VDDLTNRAAASEDVIRQVRDQLDRLPAREGKSTDFGRRFEVEIPITGPNGRSGTLFTVWQFDKGSTTPRMITNLLKVHQ